MLAGAFTAAVATYELHNLTSACSAVWRPAVIWLGYTVSPLIRFQADQVVAGMAINFLMIGCPHLSAVRSTIPRVRRRRSIRPTSCSNTLITAIRSISPRFRSRTNLTSIQDPIWPACGPPAKTQRPLTRGRQRYQVRYIGVVISGVLAAAGGAYLSIGQSSLFTRNMTAGRGFIALAALILAKWRPVPVLVACLFFGFMEALTIQMQGVVKMPSGEDIPVQFIQIIPYVLTIIVLAGFIGLSRAQRLWAFHTVKKTSYGGKMTSRCLLKHPRFGVLICVFFGLMSSKPPRRQLNSYDPNTRGMSARRSFWAAVWVRLPTN